ncbi:MAG TPA: TIGR02466 family protein [Caulobacter sp.]|nr:TIGR02466 family protein [Caulobacter sp.]
MTPRPLFVTPLYEASFAGEKGFEAFIDQLHDACVAVAEDDEAGQAWAETKGYLGYTSYASLDDLAQRDSLFADLKKKLDRHAAAFARDLHFDLAGGKLVMDSFWINILEPGGSHSGHIHPHSVISGTVYVTIPPGASALKFEDPRLPMMMAAPNRRADAPEGLQPFVYVQPTPGTILMWESWLRHEVTPNQAEEQRVSLSFNYAWR